MRVRLPHLMGCGCGFLNHATKITGGFDLFGIGDELRRKADRFHSCLFGVLTNKHLGFIVEPSKPTKAKYFLDTLSLLA